MEIKRSGSQASAKGLADWFTGTVRIDPLFQVKEPARAATAMTMTHIAIQEQLDGKMVEWMEKVSEEQYLALKANR
jgi:hypothetical protein